MKLFRRRTSRPTDDESQEIQPAASTQLIPVTPQRSSDHDDPESIAEYSVSKLRMDKFADLQSRRRYNNTFDNTLTSAGEAYLKIFPPVPPLIIPDVIPMKPAKKNHATMNYGFVEYNLNNGVKKGETANCYGDDFCQVHAITRVLVVDIKSRLIAMCTPQRYMSYMPNQMYVPEALCFKGNIFEFFGAAVATPRWAMRAAAWNILSGQNGQILRFGNAVSITGSEMINGIPKPADVLIRNVPYSGASWVVMDKWMEQARAHKISIVAANTGLENSNLVAQFDADKTLPLVIEDEADMFMGDPVYGLTFEDDRFHVLRERREITEHTKALQFRGGWYAPFSPSGITRIMRLLKFDRDEHGPRAKDGTGPWRKPERAYSNNFLDPPTSDLWMIGGVDDVHEDAVAKELGTHLEMKAAYLPAGSGGSNT